MNAPHKFPVVERNPITHAKHRREAFWQIIFPMLIGLIIVVAIVVVIIFSGTTSTSDLSRWADVSLIWLILPSLFIALIFLAILIAFTYLISVVLKITPRYARIIQIYFEMGKYKVSHYSNLITAPFVKTRSIWAVMRHPGRFVKQPPHES
ncbi:MAG: hypothetical protein A2030_10025 [Chloroflexi bacterium RBG_19FT_COMBO_50_10]|nr:MAG: hypothetical protein A2030_10025 [Chloroflexi bacterium RBG_19FT_COMBO_50_10]